MATEGSRELRREQINEDLESLMKQAVATVQKMDAAEFQAKVCGQPGSLQGPGRGWWVLKTLCLPFPAHPGSPSSRGKWSPPKRLR